VTLQKLSSEAVRDHLIMKDNYRQPLSERLIFLERDKLFKIIEKFLRKEINIRNFLYAYDEFSSEILELRLKFCSELEQLKDFQLLNIGTLELKIDSNSSYFHSLIYLLDEKLRKLADGELISEPEEQEFYELIKELFKLVQRFDK
jgi:hypothetical protein